MDIGEMIQLKIDTEEKIQSLLMEFQNKTGLVINDIQYRQIDITHISSNKGGRLLSKVHIGVEL